MTNESQSPENQVALFRYGLIADLVHLPVSRGSGLYKRLEEKASITYTIPLSRRTRVAAQTMLDWLREYRQHGYDGLKPKPRNDRGKSRKLTQEQIDALVTIKEEHPDYSVQMVIDEAKRSGRFEESLELAGSSIHRYLKHAGVMDKPAREPTNKDRRRFTFEKAGQLWMSDVMHGPSVSDQGCRKRKTYLVCLIDDATRIIPYAAFAFSESTEAFLPIFEQALRRRGIPERLYVDNGAAYRSHHLSLVCAKLGITLIHARPYQPQGKGKQERFFRTIRSSFLPTLGEVELGEIAALNRRLWGWIEGEYHQSPHRGLDGLTPFDAWAMRSDEVRFADERLDLRDVFLFEQKRKVHKDRTVSLNGVVYEVDATLVGEIVTLRYDPSKKGAPIHVWHAGKEIQVAKQVDAFANCFVKRNHVQQMVVSGPVDEPKAGLRFCDFDASKETF